MDSEVWRLISSKSFATYPWPSKYFCHKWLNAREETVFKTLALTGALLLSAAQIASPTVAQEYPQKQPVKIVVPVPAGGLTDAIARVTAEFLQRRLGQAVVVENRPGAASTIGADYVAKSPPDGYTLFLAGPEQAVVPAVRSNMPYKLEDFTFLTRPFVVQPLVMAGPKSSISSI